MVKQMNIKTKFSFYFLGLFVVTATFLIPSFLGNNEIKKEQAAAREKGKLLVEILSLSTKKSMTDNHSDTFPKKIASILSHQNFAYCLIHKKNNKAENIFTLKNIQGQIPDSIELNSLQTKGFLSQDFKTMDGKKMVEFAKPIFTDGIISSVLRLGLLLPSNSLSGIATLGITAQITGIILLALLSLYYWAAISIRPLEKLCFEQGQTLEIKGTPSNTLPGMLSYIQTTLQAIIEKLKCAQTQSHDASSQLKITAFENDYILNIFNSLDFGIMIIDSRDTIFYANDFFVGLIEKKRSDLINYPFDEIIEQDELRAYIQRLNLMEQTGESDHQELVFPGKFACQIFMASSSNIFDAQGSVFGKLILIRDITKEKETEKSTTDFVNQIAHEFRTPLTNIKAYNEILMDEEINNPEMQKEFFNTINDETNRLANLVESTLKLTKTEIGKYTVNKEFIKTDWFISGCLEAIEASAKEKSINIITDLPDNFPNISGDKELLKSAFINILGNAVKYTPQFGTITFGIKERSDKAVFEFKDTGYGISDKELPYIFNKFFRSENDRIIEQRGSGLGLAIANQIINLHDGIIEAQSKLEQGSQFTITLPKGDLSIG